MRSNIVELSIAASLIRFRYKLYAQGTCMSMYSYDNGFIYRTTGLMTAVLRRLSVPVVRIDSNVRSVERDIFGRPRYL